MISRDSHRIVVLGASALDHKVWARTSNVELGRSNPGRIRSGWGGVARNIAENLANLGAEVYLVSAVGDDQVGHDLLAHLDRVGVDTSAMLVGMSGIHTPAYTAIYNAEGELWMAFDDMRATAQITPAYLELHSDVIAQAEMICLDANLVPATLVEVFRMAGEYKIPVCVDPTAALLASRFHPYLSQIKILTPDLNEAEALLQERLADADSRLQGVRRLAQMGVELAVITLGAEGLCYATSVESGRLPAFKIDVVDPVGGGDALTAAVVYSYLEGFSPLEAVRLGMAAAAQTLSCRDTVCSTLNLEMLYDGLIV